MKKSKRPTAQPGQASRGAATAGPRSGRGAGSALEEMLRRQAQNPRPGSPAQAGPAAPAKVAPGSRGDQPGSTGRRTH